MEKNWHSLSVEEVCKKLETTDGGLTQHEVEERQIKYGKNVVPKEKDPTIIAVFFSQFKSPMIIILIIAGIVSALIGEYKEAIFILIVLVLNAILGAYQEFSAIKNASSIQKLLKISTKVIRDGKTIEMDSEDLVPGDIVVLESGDKVPADIRVIQAQNLQLDESFLTGESIGVKKNIDVVKLEAAITDRSNIGYAGSTVQSGRGMGVVIQTGVNTEIGTIAVSLAEAKEVKSPLTIRMENFIHQIMKLIFVFAAVTAVLMLIKGNAEPYEIFLLIVAMCVSAIPESLPIAQTVVLSIATSKMVKRNVIVKKLSSVESLGSCTIIASDKTGTLTVNQQTAKIMSLPDGSNFEISGEGYNDKGDIDLKDVSQEQNSLVEHLCKMGVINNEAFMEKKDGVFVHHGDSVDLAFLSLGLKYGIKEEEIKQELNIFGRIPYESENKCSAVLFEKDNESYITVKGSSETILEFCTTQMVSGHAIPLEYEKLEQEFLRLSADGFRVIALASGKYYGERKDVYEIEDIDNLTFIGFVGFIDPIRNTSKDAIKKCHGAGIRVLMITGDHPLTAKAISKELSLIDEKSSVITGNEVEEAYNTSKEKLNLLLKQNNVFARVSPLQKSIIVETLREQGEFIAVTGDGVNDAPALKKANIGVAMGSGTDVAKDASTMIITDDNFLSIVSAVEEGRHAYGNIRKVIYLLISTAFAEILLLMSSIIFNLPLPFTPVQILWINLVTNGIQDMAIACEKGEKGVMNEKPRATNERIFDKLLTREVIISGATMFVLVFVFWQLLNVKFVQAGEMTVATARNYILLLMVILQNVHAFNCRSEKTSVFKIPLKNNRFIVYAVAGALILHIVFMNVPGLQGILTTNPVQLKEFFIIALMTLPLLIVMELFKFFNKKFAIFSRTKLVR